MTPAWAGTINGGYANGLYIQTDDEKYRLKFNFQLQPQYQFLSIDHQGDVSTFQLRRAKIFFSGHAFTKPLTYQFEFDLASGRTFTVSPGRADSGPSLQDAFLNYAFSDALKVRVGQFKVYFSREELSYTSHLQFVDLSLTNEVFSFHRDIGVALHGTLDDKKWEYAFYVMDDGSNRNAANKNKAVLLGGRFLWNILGEPAYAMGDINYSESDISHSETPQLAVAVASNFNRVRPIQTASDNSVSSATSDVIYRYRGLSALGIGYYTTNLNLDTQTFGYLGQVGYFLIPKHFEVASRYAGVMPSGPSDSNGYEIGFDLNYYFYGHKLKLQADYNILINSPLVYGAGGAAGVSLPNNIVTTGGAPGFNAGQDDHQARLQLQLYL
ncbi:MAG: porin [Deltaproteobacteria bacterium]|nr:porin [Deltaproteobacteria bacterium]